MTENPLVAPLGRELTEFGFVPKDWSIRALGDLGDVIRGSSPRPKGDKRFYGGHVPRLMVEDITRDRHWVRPAVDFLTEEGAKRSRLCQRGTLTVVCSGTPTAVGLPALLAIDACIHDGILALVRTKGQVLPDFLFHQLANDQQRLHAAATHGGTFVNLTTQGFGQYLVALPPTLAEQEAIAEALSDADAWIESLEQLIAKKRCIKQGAMQELLTGKTRLPGFGTHPFVETALSDLGRWHGGMTPSMRNPSYWDGGSFPWVSSGDVKSPRLLDTTNHITQAAIRDSTTTVLPASSVIIVNRSGILRRYLPVAMLMRDMAINQDIKGLVAKPGLSPEFVLHALTLHGDEVLATCLKAGTTVESIELSWLKSFTIQLPAIEEQVAIGECLSDMDAEIDALEAKLQKARQIKQGMMQELLTGRTRLVESETVA